MVAKTDGYITDTQSGDWRYSNTGQGSRGDVTDGSVFGDAYMRFERQDGAVAGTAVDALGVVTAGPVIDFTSLDSLLSGAPSSPGAPNVVWAGVSPLSLNEVLIVWNQPIVLLDKAKVIGGDNVSVAGRLMVVALDSPIAIDGEEQATITLQPGAVGVYGQEGPKCVDPEAEPPVTNITEGEPSGELEDLPTVTNPCGSDDCGAPIIGGAGSAAASGTGAQVEDARLFAEQLCQDGGCDPPAELIDGDLSFTANNQMSVPVRCCHPFYLLQLWLNGTSGACKCKVCPVWLACLAVYGSTIPGEVFPLDQLVTVTSPCDMAQQFLQGVDIPAILQNDVGCCGSASVQIVGNSGPAVGISGNWTGRLPGLAGQSVYVNYKMSIDCADTPCQTIVSPDSEADVWVEEGILKPRARALPVAFFDPLKLYAVNVSIPKVKEESVDIVQTCPTLDIPVATINRYEPDTAIDAVAAPTAGAAVWLRGCVPITIDVCPPGGGALVPIEVLTGCTTEAVVPVSIAQVKSTAASSVLISPATLTVAKPCEPVIVQLLKKDGDPQVVNNVATIDPAGNIVVPQETTPDCSRTWKFVMHDGTPQTWTQIGIDVNLPCGPTFGCSAGRFCVKTEPTMPNEVDCIGVNLTTPIWVSRSEAPGDGGCPGYDCSPENGPQPPKGSDIPNGPGGPVSCGILIRRPQRRPFVRCRT